MSLRESLEPHMFAMRAQKFFRGQRYEVMAMQVVVFAGGVNDFATGAPDEASWVDGYATFIQNVRISSY